VSRGRFFYAIATVISAAILAGCDSRAMNDPDAFGIRFKNDLAVPVVLALCHSDHSAECEHPYYRASIRPGDSTEENISPGVRTEWAIETATKRPLRCILLYWKYWPKHDMQVAASDAPVWSNPCGRETPAAPLK
jgi:hypothetical protein